MIRPACLILLVTLTSCAGSGGGESQAPAATVAACRQRADQIDHQQNRAGIYAPAPGVNTPFSGNYAPGMSERGLSDLFAHDNAVRDCVRNTGTSSDREAAQPSPAKP